MIHRAVEAPTNFTRLKLALVNCCLNKGTSCNRGGGGRRGRGRERMSEGKIEEREEGRKGWKEEGGRGGEGGVVEERRE